MLKLIKLSIILLLLFNVFTIGLLSALAADNTDFVPSDHPGQCPDDYSGNCGNYQLNDFMQIALFVSQFILGIVGSLALLAFIVGGLMWLLSGGKAELVQRGKQTIIGAAVGLAIVFTSFMIIQLVFSALGIPGAENGKWAISNWFKNNSSSYPQNEYGPN